MPPASPSSPSSLFSRLLFCIPESLLLSVRRRILSNPQFFEAGLGTTGACGVLDGFLLGFSCAVLYFLSASLEHIFLTSFCVYLVFLFVFHLLEFFMTALFHPETVTAESWLFNHSVEYVLAVLACMVEFWLEAYFLPSFKHVLLSSWIVPVGIVVVGHSLNSPSFVFPLCVPSWFSFVLFFSVSLVNFFAQLQ